MSHIFISYSHKDTEYAHALAEHLQSMGFPIWIDDRIDYGSQWPREIQKHLDSCDAFILIMSPPLAVATPIVLPVQLPDGSEVRMIDVAARNEYHYTVLSAQREVLSQDKYLLRLRLRAGTSAASLGFWSDSFRLVAGDLSIAPINHLNLVVMQNETMDGEIEFEINASLPEAILRITVAYSPDPWATKELHLVFP